MSEKEFIAELYRFIDSAFDDAQDALLEGVTDGTELIHEGRLELALAVITKIKMWEKENGKAIV